MNRKACVSALAMRKNSIVAEKVPETVFTLRSPNVPKANRFLKRIAPPVSDRSRTVPSCSSVSIATITRSLFGTENRGERTLFGFAISFAAPSKTTILPCRQRVATVTKVKSEPATRQIRRASRAHRVENDRAECAPEVPRNVGMFAETDFTAGGVSKDVYAEERGWAGPSANWPRLTVITGARVPVSGCG